MENRLFATAANEFTLEPANGVPSPTVTIILTACSITAVANHDGSKTVKRYVPLDSADETVIADMSEYFTNGRGDYRVDSIDYDNGTQTTSVEFIDDQGDLHWVSDGFLAKNFTPTIVKNFRHV